jgi:hypothetical protein
MTLPDGVTWGELFGLDVARPLLRGRGGLPPCLATVRLWITRGYKPHGAPESSRVFLKAVRQISCYCTCKRWCDEFNLAQLAAGLTQPQPEPDPNVGDRQ